MNQHARRIRKPRCFLLYALAIFHDHFIGQTGGVVIFYEETAEERDALLAQTYLDGWRVELQPLIFSYSPSAFDEQIAFTLRAYRGVDWGWLRKEKRPSYGNPGREAETAQEEE